VLSYAGSFVGDGAASWSAGIVFGLLVLGPSAGERAGFVALAAFSVAVYRVAVWLAQWLVVQTPVPELAACALAGVLGAVALSLGAGTIVGAGAPRGATARAAAWGLLGGLLIGLAIGAPDESLLQRAGLLAGFVVWQVGYTASHRLAPWRMPDAGLAKAP
jgi:hypothetical protein